MTLEQIQDKMIRGVARSMEAEGADYERVLKRMQNRIKTSHKKGKKS